MLHPSAQRSAVRRSARRRPGGPHPGAPSAPIHWHVTNGKTTLSNGCPRRRTVRQLPSPTSTRTNPKGWSNHRRKVGPTIAAPTGSLRSATSSTPGRARGLLLEVRRHGASMVVLCEQGSLRRLGFGRIDVLRTAWNERLVPAGQGMRPHFPDSPGGQMDLGPPGSLKVPGCSENGSAVAARSCRRTVRFAHGCGNELKQQRMDVSRRGAAMRAAARRGRTWPY